MNGNVLWYSVTWLVFLITSIVIAWQFEDASPLLMSLVFGAICLAIGKFDKSSGFGGEYFPYVTGTTLAIYLTSRLALCRKQL